MKIAKEHEHEIYDHYRQYCERIGAPAAEPQQYEQIARIIHSVPAFMPTKRGQLNGMKL